MAQKKPGSTSKTTVRRITADDNGPKKKAKAVAKKTIAKPKQATKSPTVVKKPKKEAVNQPKESPLSAFTGYFKGAWFELKQVRWPTRANTWSMTLAVILFTAMFVALILLLDAGFKWLFEQILK